MAPSNVATFDEGMKCLVRGLGDAGAERFISLLLRERFDYTEWQQGLFEGLGVEALHRAAAQYESENPPQPGRAEG